MIHSLTSDAFLSAPVILYGGGECSHWFVEIAMKRHGIRPVAVLDRKFKPGGLWHGIAACPPAEFRADDTLRRDAIVVIAVGEVLVQREIQAWLKGAGFRHIVPLREIYEIHNPLGLPDIETVRWTDFFDRRSEDIARAARLLADDESRAVFAAFVETHRTRRPVPLPQRPRKEQYFPKDVPLSRGHARYVCCGAYDGDTLRLLNETCGKVEAIACFEPETAIYRRLTDYLHSDGTQLAARILTWPCAVHGSTDLRRFIPGDGLGSRVSDQGSAWVQCVTLDDALADFDATFVSMDIEGAEPAALRGAERLLRRHRPDLGVCVYHSPCHAWEIPFYLHGLDLDYRFYLRNYTGFAIETVLYATR